MNLGNFDIKNPGKGLLTRNVLSSFVNNFINELKDYLEKSNNKDNMNIDNQNKYSNYWNYQNFMEDSVSAKIGLSRWGNDITYHDELDKIVDDTILDVASKEGSLYRKQFTWNGSNDGGFYNVDKFDNGQITNLTIPRNSIPSELENQDLIFQYTNKGAIKIRDDLKEKIIDLASQKAGNLKEQEQEINTEYKKEGHVYEAFEDDGYIFLNDLTEKRNFSIEDIDFVVDNYEGEGKYKVVDGEYKKIVTV